MKKKTQPENKKRKFLEKDFQTLFNAWCKNIFKRTAAFELKATENDSLPFNAVQEHQVLALLQVRHHTFVYKIPDLGNQNPFDSFMMSGADAFVVIMFRSKDVGQKEFVMIPIEHWVAEQKSVERKSITMERAYEIGVVYSL